MTEFVSSFRPSKNGCKTLDFTEAISENIGISIVRVVPYKKNNDVKAMIPYGSEQTTSTSYVSNAFFSVRKIIRLFSRTVLVVLHLINTSLKFDSNCG